MGVYAVVVSLSSQKEREWTTLWKCWSDLCWNSPNLWDSFWKPQDEKAFPPFSWLFLLFQFFCVTIIFPHFRTVTLGWAVRVVEGWHSSFSWLCLFLITPIWRSSYPAGIASARQQKNLLPVHPQMSAIEVLYNHKLQDLSSITLLPSAAGFVS